VRLSLDVFAENKIPNSYDQIHAAAMFSIVTTRFHLNHLGASSAIEKEVNNA
jgi:hypothetical protein